MEKGNDCKFLSTMRARTHTRTQTHTLTHTHTHTHTSAWGPGLVCMIRFHCNNTWFGSSGIHDVHTFAACSTLMCGHVQSHFTMHSSTLDPNCPHYMLNLKSTFRIKPSKKLSSCEKELRCFHCLYSYGQKLSLHRQRGKRLHTTNTLRGCQMGRQGAVFCHSNGTM